MDQIVSFKLPFFLLCLLFLLSLLAIVGCKDENQYQEVAKVATQAADRQAEQNAEMASLNREVAAGTKRLVEADADARKDFVTVHQEIQAERTTLHSGFDQLEAERQEIADERRTESMLVPAIQAIGGTILAIAVVLLCLVLVCGVLCGDTADADVNELLISELVSENPQLLLGPSRIPGSAPRLTAPDQPEEHSNSQGDP